MKRFIQYCVIGLIGVLVDMTVLFVLADPRMLCWHLVPSKILASEIAIINNFIWNDRWTFRDRRGQLSSVLASLGRFAKFNLICGFGLFLNVLLLSFATSVLKLNMYLANLLAIIMVTIWNYSLNYFFSWRKGAGPTPVQTVHESSNLT